MLQVIAGLDPQNGGPSYSVPRLAAALTAGGIRQTTLAVASDAATNHVDTLLFSQNWARIAGLRGLRASSALKAALYQRAGSSDLVHVHGLWLMPNVYAGRAAERAGKPLIVSPRGMVAPAALAFSRHRKAVFWRLLQGPAYAGAALWHATSSEEAEDIRRFGVAAPIAVIPNGIDLPSTISVHPKTAQHRTILFLSRLHPKKNLPVLLKAWQRIAVGLPDWRLVIAGPDEGGHRALLEAQVAKLVIPRVLFAGPLYGAAKEALIKSADLFVLPTLSENFGIAVAELLAAGVPAIVTKGAPWQGLESHRAGWWIDHGVDPLEVALRTATALTPGERQAMGARGRDWMARDFGWDGIGREMIAVYRWALGQADRPACVLTN